MSIHQVAKLAGVSHTTVSRVINHKPGVSAERAKMVREVMERLAYTPKPRGQRRGPTARSMVKLPRTLDVFALVAPELAKGLYPALQQGFATAAADRGLQIIASPTDNDIYKQADVLIQLIDKGVAGVAMVPASVGLPPAHHIRLLHHYGIPVVLLHRAVSGVTAPLITLPAERIGEMAGERIAKAGHKRVAYLATQRGRVAEQYERGFRTALKAEGVALPDSLVDYADMRSLTPSDYEQYRAHATAALHRLMKGPNAPTVLFTSFEASAEVLYLEAL
ncbi:MAG: LacI family DNA-binding transcriptional regulator, partial [Phycisphaeraceae bacterium]